MKSLEELEKSCAVMRDLIDYAEYLLANPGTDRNLLQANWERAKKEFLAQDAGKDYIHKNAFYLFRNTLEYYAELDKQLNNSDRRAEEALRLIKS